MKNSTSRLWASTSVFALIASHGVLGKAQDVPPLLPETVTLEQARDLLESHSPAFKIAHAQVDIAAAERLRAGVYANPSLNYGGLVLAKGANTGARWQHQLVVEQPVPVFGQVSARENFAERNLNAQRQRSSVGLSDRWLAVQHAFITLLSQQERVRVLEEVLQDLSGVADIVRGRYEAGDQSAYELERLQLEVDLLRIELRNARTAAIDASGVLAASLGFANWTPKAAGSLAPRARVEDVSLLQQNAEKKRPAVAAAHAEVGVAKGALALAQRERLPILGFALGSVSTQGQDSQSVYFGLSLPLPIFDRGQGDIARANAHLRAQERQLELEIAQTRAVVASAHAVYVQHRATLDEVERQMVQKIPMLGRMAEIAYRGGAGGILELLDALRSIRNIRLIQLEQLQAVKLAEASLLTLAGVESITLESARSAAF